MNKHRFDNRTKKEFKKEIAEKTLLERKLFLKWLAIQEEELGYKIKFKDNDGDNRGEYIEDHKVSTKADFDVEEVGLIEVKFSKPLINKFFHLKVNQVQSYIQQNASILMVNGANEEIPQYTILTPKALITITHECKQIPWAGFGGKISFKVPINNYIWRHLR